jgi:superfamily II DNA or RNA helicase
MSRLAPGLATYIARENVDPIRFTIAPVLFPAEHDALIEAVTDPDRVLAAVPTIFEQASAPNASALSRHAVACLAWMVAVGRMDIRVAIPEPGSNYHPKVWLFSDGTDTVSIRGSANATGRAIGVAVEHMDVDCSWDNSERVLVAQRMVADWAAGRDPGIARSVALSEAVRERIVRLAPESPPTPEDYQRAARTATVARKGARRFEIPPQLRWREGTYGYQREAVEAWESHNRRGVLAMATGAGKTITALIAAQRSWQAHRGPLLIVISAPANPLIRQWQQECTAFGLAVTTPTLHGSKRAKQMSIASALLRFRQGGEEHVEAMIVTNNLLSATDFQRTLIDALQRREGARILHIGDEAHTLGSPAFVKNPPEHFEWRLGLSATPERQFDDDGTARLFQYFGETVYEFGLDRAIGFCLVPYRYFVHIAELNGEELGLFNELSVKIGRAVAVRGKDAAPDDALTALLIRRRAVTEGAAGKIAVLRDILSGRDSPVRKLLVYATSKNPEQLLAAKAVVANLGLVSRQVTQDESGDPDLLRSILDGFTAGDYEVLLAKRVLDEGVNIPDAREAILLSSSTVEREWIQRRGRILRMSPGKEMAVLHDVLALPPVPKGLAHEESVLAFISRELDRVRAFAKHAMNATDVLKTVESIHEYHLVEAP